MALNSSMAWRLNCCGVFIALLYVGTGIKKGGQVCSMRHTHSLTEIKRRVLIPYPPSYVRLVVLFKNLPLPATFTVSDNFRYPIVCKANSLRVLPLQIHVFAPTSKLSQSKQKDPR